MLISDKYYSDPGKVLRGVDLSYPNLIISSECLQIYGNSISDYCFMYSKDTLESFSFQPNPKLTKIGPYSFYQCTKLSRIDLSPCTQLIIVDSYAFQGCSSVTTLLLPNGLQNISIYAFSRLKISSVVIPSSVTYIAERGFSDSSTLTSVTFEEGSKLATLESHVFMSTSLTKITIPESVTKISGPFFNNILTLKNIYVHSNNHIFKTDGSAIYSPDYTKIHAYAPNASESYEINSKVVHITAGAFTSAQFTSVTIPPTVKYIYNYAFQYTTNLKQITLPPNLTAISINCFYGSGLTSIEIPSQVTTISTGAFANCYSLTKVVLPESIKTIEGNAFPLNINIVLSSSSSLYLDNQMLLIQSDNTSIIMCFNSAATSITIPSRVKTIKNSAFKQKNKLKTIVCDGISELEYIENNAFDGCTSLTTIPSFPMLKSIGFRAFYQTKLNSNMIISQNVSYIGPSSFEQSTIPGITISSQVESLGIYNYAFKDCLSLSQVSFQVCSASVTIGTNCFENCKSLGFFNVVSNIKEIGSSSFINSGISHISFDNKRASFKILDTMLYKDCIGLEEIDIPSNILTIGNECFSGTSIRKLSIPDSVEILSSKCFSNCINLERVEIAS